MSDSNYKTISELPIFPGSTVGSELLMVSKYSANDKSDAVSYQLPAVELANCLSDALLTDLSNTMLSDLKDLARTSKQELEYDMYGAQSTQLTSFSHKRIKDTAVDVDPDRIVDFKSNVWTAVSAIQQNYNHEITKVDYIDLHDVSAASHEDMLQHLKKLNIDEGITLTSLVGMAGIPLAQINGRTPDVPQVIYSGDPCNLVNIEPATTVGNEIANISFGGVAHRITLRNALSVNQINPSYNPDGYVGETIAYINGVELKNNVSVTTCCDGDRVIANINGYELSNGVFIAPSTEEGDVIAVINDKNIHNGVVVKQNPQVGRVAFNIVGTDVYNNVNVDDKTDTLGGVIANVNGKNIYNGVEVEDNTEQNLTYIKIKKPDGTTEDHKLLAGIKLGGVIQTTTKGDVIARIETTDRTVPVYNGINTAELSGNIVAELQAEIDRLRAQHEADMEWIKNELKKYMLLNSGSTTQTVVGPTTFVERITGNITNADYAIRAKWS